MPVLSALIQSRPIIHKNVFSDINSVSSNGLDTQNIPYEEK